MSVFQLAKLLISVGESPVFLLVDTYSDVSACRKAGFSADENASLSEDENDCCFLKEKCVSAGGCPGVS